MTLSDAISKMRHPYGKHNAQYGPWKEWYAWYPVRIVVRDADGEPRYTWVWRTTIAWRTADYPYARVKHTMTGSEFLLETRHAIERTHLTEILKDV